jgi:4-hydroxythreonine-4-phosphate dehydrogenase
MKKSIITGITMGEPAGISSEITLKIWKNYRRKIEPFIFFGDPDHLVKTCVKLKMKIPIKIIKNINESVNVFKNYLPVYKIKLSQKVNFGSPSIKNARKVLKSIDKVVNFAYKREISSVVTNPVEKNIIKKKSKNFNGHTFYIAKLLKVKKPIMLLKSPKISVVPITQHLSLRNALKAINKKVIISIAETTNKYLKIFFGKKTPKIAVASLNPHAGDDGIFGNEEKKIIIPAIKKIRKMNIDAYGPYPADTIFNNKFSKQFDVIICMYHDQATIPIKTIDFDNGVNITLGLPIIRTSPDHGTALDIAGSGKASEKSLYASIKMSQDIARKRKLWIQ